jgi:hypothetical protein
LSYQLDKTASVEKTLNRLFFGIKMPDRTWKSPGKGRPRSQAGSSMAAGRLQQNATAVAALKAP